MAKEPASSGASQDGLKENKSRKKETKTKKVIKQTGRTVGIVLKSLFFALLTFGIIFLVIVLGTYVNYANEFEEAEPRSNTTKNIFLDKNKDVIYESFGTAEPDYVSLSDTPKLIIDSTLAAEDDDFYDHGAIDPTGMLRAAYLNIKESDRAGVAKIYDLFAEENYSQGGSSITQQLVKNLYLTTERSFDRKIREIVYAFELEKRYSKDEILEMYINNVYYGEQSLGIKNAANVYYGKALEDLNLGEASMLAGLPVAPTRLSPISGDFEAAKNRQKYVLSQMYHNKMITIEEATKAAAETLYFGSNKADVTIKYPYFVNYVKTVVKDKVGEESYNNGGIVVETTLDPALQKIAEEEAASQVNLLKYKNVSNAAVVIVNNKTGELQAMVGGIDHNESKVNVATSRRQPGSSFKPIVYIAGLLDEYTAASMLWDASVNFGGTPPYRPRNYDGRYRGNVTVRTALQNSLNVPAVEMTQLVGVDKVIETAKKLGITSIDEDRYYGLSIGLGSAEVELLDMARAYSTIANLGERPNITVIDKISTATGEEIYAQPESKEKTLDEKVAYIMTNILSDNNARRSVFGTRSSLYLKDRPVAAKTGTTDSFADNWTLGFTPQYTVGVWVGNNDHSVMKNISGLDGAAPIWNKVMTKIHQELPVKQFIKPKGLKELWISPYTGKPATYQGGSNILEYFIPGTEPTRDEKFDYLNQFKRFR